MKSFFIAVEPRRGRAKQDTFSVMARYKDDDSPFEQTRKVATCVDESAAKDLQELFDLASDIGSGRSSQRVKQQIKVAHKPQASISEQADGENSTNNNGPMKYEYKDNSDHFQGGYKRCKNPLKDRFQPAERPVISGKEIGVQPAEENDKRNK